MVNADTKMAKTAFTFLFDSLPVLDLGEIADKIKTIESIKTEVSIDMQVNALDVFRAFLEFEDHKFQLVGFSVAVPRSVVDFTIGVSNWSEKDKTPLLQHKAHVICYYEGTNSSATEQIIALYKVAYSFYDRGLLGILDEDAWTCTPRNVIANQVTPEMLSLCRESMPLEVWSGFVKMFKNDNNTWFCTKGYHRFGVNDFAYLGELSEADFAFNFFTNLFHYVYSTGAKLEAGNTAQFSEDMFIKFGNVYEYNEYLDSPLGTLVIEKVKPFSK
jgi:Domain of unknown function (DUF4261)